MVVGRRQQQQSSMGMRGPGMGMRGSYVGEEVGIACEELQHSSVHGTSEETAMHPERNNNMGAHALRNTPPGPGPTYGAYSCSSTMRLWSCHTPNPQRTPPPPASAGSSAAPRPAGLAARPPAAPPAARAAARRASLQWKQRKLTQCAYNLLQPANCSN